MAGLAVGKRDEFALDDVIGHVVAGKLEHALERGDGVAFRAQIAPPEPPPTMFFGTPMRGDEPVEAAYDEEPAAPEPPQPPRRSSLGINPYAAVPASQRQLRTNREEEGAAPKPAAAASVGCNDPCPCGSGKKYKNCHGRSA